MLFPSNMIGNANFKTNFLHKLLLNNIKFATFENLKLSKTQMPKIIESGESLGKLGCWFSINKLPLQLP